MTRALRPFALLLASAGTWALPALPAQAQQPPFAAGARVVAKPTWQWEACTVKQWIADSRAYEVACRTGEYFVPASSVRAPTPEMMALTLPPSAAPGMPQVGDAVLASPMSLDNDWRECVVTKDLTYQGAYEVRCGTTDWTVVMKSVKKVPPGYVSRAPAPGAGPGAGSGATPAPPAMPAPAVSPAPVPPGPPPAAPPVAAAPVPPPVAAPIAPATAPADGRNGVIPDGVYVAPRGGSIEVIQVIGARLALGPRVHLRAETMTTANAVLVGRMQVAGNTLTVTWNDGKERTGNFRMDTNCLVWGYIYCRAKPFARGARLEGTYIGAATAGGGVVSRTSNLQFRPDGTYEFSATGGISAPAGTTGAASSTSGDRGRYRLDGWTLTLTSERGETREYLTFPYDIYGPADPIYFDGGFMRKRQ